MPGNVRPAPRLGNKPVGQEDSVEIFFTTLLVVITLIVAWFTVYTVYSLFKGQS
jgi:hypothetical protein